MLSLPIALTIALVYTRNATGPMQLPCGTPQVRGNSCDAVLLITTHRDRFGRYYFSQETECEERFTVWVTQYLYQTAHERVRQT